MINRTTAITPPPPPPPVSTTVVCSRVTSSRSSAIGNSPIVPVVIAKRTNRDGRGSGPGNRMKPIIGIFALVLLLGCEQRTVPNSNAMQRAEQPPSNMMQGAPQAKETANVALPDDRALLAEPKGPSGPKVRKP